MTFINTDLSKVPHKMKPSDIKANIAQILNNLRQLDSEQISLNSTQSVALQQTTTSLLDTLEEALPIAEAQVKSRIQQRKLKRWRRPRYKEKKQQKVEVVNAAGIKSAPDQQSPNSDFTLAKTSELSFSQRRCKDAVKVLQKFKLLERLCKVRGGDNTKLTQTLNPMRQVWQRVIHENTEEMPKSLESQWHIVLFGQDACLAEPEGKEKFVQKRFIWDSYLTQGNWGSCIPSSWVLPTEEASPHWAEFKCQ